MFLVQCILCNKFRYWLALNREGYFWVGIIGNAHQFKDPERAESIGLAYSKVDFTIEKIIE